MPDKSVHTSGSVRYFYLQLNRMQFIRSFLLFSTVSILCSCRGCFRNVSDAVLPSGGNPELVSYLQGTWALTSDNKIALQIKRDSVIEFYGDSATSTRNLAYVFAGTAESYFTKDSAFDFLAKDNRSLSTDEFKLVENGQASTDTTTHLLAFVSKSRLVLNTVGKFTEFKRVINDK